VIDNQGVVLFWRSTNDLVYGTLDQRFTIPAWASPPFPLNSQFVGYDLARSSFTTVGAFSTSADAIVPNTFDWTVGTFPTRGIVSFVASGQGTSSRAGPPSINDAGDTLVYRDSSTPAGSVQASVVGSLRTLDLGQGVTQ